MLSVRGIYENEQIKLLERLPYKKRMNVIVTVLEEDKIKKPRAIGLAKGKFEVSPHFFDELPDDLLNAFEGKDICKLSISGSPECFIREQREQHDIDTLPLDEVSALHLPVLPKLHRDPFDRMLVCQAIEHNLTILTPDPMII